MMLKLKEVYRKINLEGAQRVTWQTRDIYINKDNITMLRPNDDLKRILTEGSWSNIPKEKRNFTVVCLKDKSEVTVLGTVMEVQDVINGKSRVVLHG